MGRRKSQIARWVSLILSCFVVTTVGLGVATVATMGDAADGGRTPPAPWRGPNGHHPIAIAREMVPPPPPEVLSGDDSEWDRYDNIVVEVEKDGTLRVLGEQMAMDAFKTLLGEQLREQLQTVVTIYPDDNCPFRHVGPVISVCEQAGVRHQTLSKLVATATSGDPA